MTLSRRSALALSAAALAAPAFAAKAADPIAGWTVINALGGLDDPNHPSGGAATITPRMLADAHASGETAVNITLGFVFGSGDPYEQTKRDIARWDGLVRANPGDLMKIL